MTPLSVYVNEGKTDPGSVKYLGYSFDEMHEDLEKLDDFPTVATKKEVAAKYQFDSKKVKEITDAIYLQLRELRKQKKEFTEQDYRDFQNMDVPAKTRYTSESVTFLMWLKDRNWNYLVSKGLDKKVSFASGRDWNYHMCGSDKYAIERYLDACKALDALDPKKNAAKKEKEELVDVIKMKLFEQTGEFHDAYIKAAREYAEKHYDYLLDAEPKLKKKCKKAEEEAYDYDMHHSWRDPEARRLRDLAKEARSNFAKVAAILEKFRTKSAYVDDTAKMAEEKFNSNITNLAVKIDQKEFDKANIKVERIDDDPKFFELLVSDGAKRLYARSIWAAEGSEYMIPHFRFIITDRRKAK